MGTTKGFLRPTQLRTQESLLFERPIVFSNGKAIILAVNDTKIAIFGGVEIEFNMALSVFVWSIFQVTKSKWCFLIR